MISMEMSRIQNKKIGAWDKDMLWQAWKKLLCLLLVCLCLLFSACNSNTSGKQEHKETEVALEEEKAEQKVQEQFDRFMMRQFLEEVQSDSITLHYSLVHPEQYEMKQTLPTLGQYGQETWDKNIRKAKSVREELEGYEYDCLTSEQQLCYDILKYALDITIAGEPYFLYEEVLGPTTGLQAQLPVLLAEYRFDSLQDVKDYIKLLACVYDYYADILEVERCRAEAGLFLPDRAVDDIVMQCRAFVEEKENHFLLQSFEERLSTLTEVGEDERLSLVYENKKAVENYVMPAYQMLIDGLEELKGSGRKDGGLCELPEGAAYYEWLVHYNTASDWSIEQMKIELETIITAAGTKIRQLYREDPSITEQALHPTWKETDPEKILAYLQEAILTDYPAIQETSYSVKYVDESLQEYLSPAFFLTPALDDEDNLSIYINPSETNGNRDGLFTTLGHEGFPGHLYESVRFNQTNPIPLRQMLSFSGYSEGWATYAEYHCYEYAGLPESVAEMISSYHQMILAICGRVDIGIHYDGWKLSDTFDYLKGYGLAKTERDAEGIYWSCIEDPANTLEYIIGYLEFEKMRNEAEAKASLTEFDTIAYHTKLLDLGPAPFPVLKKWMQ